MKNLRKLDPFSMQFIDRVSDEQILIALSEKTYNYYLRAGDLDAVATIALARIELLYYKHSSIVKAQAKGVSSYCYTL